MSPFSQALGPAEFFLSLVASYLPRFYRERWFGTVTPDLRRGALLTGIGQMLVCLGLFVFGYLRWIAYLGALFAQAYAASGMEMSERNYAAGVGMTALTSYMLRPVTLVLVYFTLEGLLRMTAALITSETVPTLPLVLVAFLHRRLEHNRQENYWGMRVHDVVQQGDGTDFDLRVLSCRPKDWGSLVTLSYDGELYVVEGVERAPSPRRFAYLLRKLPPGTVARGLREYDPEEPVKSAR